MQYSVLFFATSSKTLAQKMSGSTEEVMEKVRQFVEDTSNDPDAVDLILTAAKEICVHNVPADAPQPYFDALYAILSVLAERIDMQWFEFGTCLYMEDVGIWPWTQQIKPPFPLPRKREDSLPAFGYLSCDFMQTTVLPDMENLPPCEMGGKSARNEFEEIVESVVSDGLDMFVYYSLW